MKLFQAAVLALMFAAVLRLVLGRPKSRARSALRYSFIGLFGALVFAVTRPQHDSSWSVSRPLALQTVMLDEGDAYPYQGGLVAMPAAFPLPAFSGDVIAAARSGSTLAARWEGDALLISAELPDGTPAVLLCGLINHRGVPLKYERPPEASRCDKNEDI